MSRVLLEQQATWLCQALTHPQPTAQQPKGVHILNVQHRIALRNPLCRVEVSVRRHPHGSPFGCDEKVGCGALADHPRTIWYVLDEDTDIPSRKSVRNEGLETEAGSAPTPPNCWKSCLKTPFWRKARASSSVHSPPQASAMRQFFSQKGLSGWRSSTVHSQQGTEADIVIFDTVNAGSYGWSYDEWQRLINVGVSRAKHRAVFCWRAGRKCRNRTWLRFSRTLHHGSSRGVAEILLDARACASCLSCLHGSAEQSQLARFAT